MSAALLALGYRVLGPIARGGMAEIFLAERHGAAGVKKAFALKMLLPDMALDPDFVTMFRNEAKIAIDLQNANIVSVFEFGEAAGQLFLAMEYVRGWELARVLGACARMRQVFPQGVALYVALEVAKALAYAHEKRDAGGAALGIVHRDVSPSNVLISMDGEVKLADFGIARAATVSKSTAGLWLKGKVPYMSPEQATASKLDARSDLYSLGIVLFEMLTARRLFSASGQPSLLRKVRNPEVPRVSSVRLDVSPRIDELVATALQPDPAKRFQTAREMQTALSVAMRELFPDASSAQLRDFLGELALPAPVSPANHHDGEETCPVSERPAPAAHKPEGAKPNEAEAAPPRTKAPRNWVPAAAVGTLFVLSLLLARRISGPDGSVTRLEVRTLAPGATVWVDGVEKGRTPLILRDLPAQSVQVRIGSGKGPAATTIERTIDLLRERDQVLDLAEPDKDRAPSYK